MARTTSGAVQLLRIQFVGANEYEELELTQRLTEQDLADHIADGSPLRVRYIDQGQPVNGVINTVHIALAALVPVDS